MVKRSIPFKVYLTPTENERVQARVDAAGLSRSQYGHLVLTSPFADELKRADEQRQEKRELCSLLAKQYVTLSLMEEHLEAFLEGATGQADFSGLQPLLHQLQSELRQTQAEVGELARWLRSDVAYGR